MDMEIIKPFLASIARHAITSAGVYLGFTGTEQTQFVGAGMVLAGLGWSWWQKRGQAQVTDLLKKMTATKSHDEAVDVAKALPPASPVAVNKAIVSGMK